MSNTRHHATRGIRHAQRMSARTEIALIAIAISFALLTNTIDENLCWKLSTVTVLLLWLVTKSFTRTTEHPSHGEHLERLARMSQLAEFGRLASGVFHDLASPISALILELQGIQKGQNQTESMRHHLSVSMRASVRIATFISILRKHFRSEKSRELFSANEIIEDALAIFNHKALKIKAEMRFDSTHQISLHGDPVDFYQIVSNLISNAIDSYDGMLKKGNVEHEHDGHVLITLGVRKRRVILKVRDWGSGIAPSVLPNIFNQFFTTKSSNSALGIGLYVTKRAVEIGFKGSIQVESKEGSGTTFTVRLPSSDISSP